MFTESKSQLLRLGATALLIATIHVAPSQQTTEPKVASAAESGIPLRGINLATAPWYASASLEPTAAPADITSQATLTTPTVTLRNPAGSYGTLFTVIDLAAPPKGVGAEVIIGDLEGNDETFFNGTRIGATTGTGVSDYGRPRVYYIPASVIQRGANVLAVRMSGTGGRETFGIRREPLTFAFVRRQSLSTLVENPKYKPALGATAISEEQARTAIAEADPESSRTEKLLRKRPSFGRFGRYFHDGLPAVSYVSPTRLENRNAPVLDVALDTVTDVSIAAGEDEPGIDSFHKLSRVQGQVGNKDTRYTALQHVLYPGVVFTLEEGPVLQFRVRYLRGQGIHQALSEAEAREVFGNATVPVTVYGFYEPTEESVPALFVATGASANVSQAEGYVDISFSRPQNSKAPAKVFVIYPTGLRRIDLSARPKSLFGVAQIAEPELKPAETLQRWLRVALNEPVAMDEYFQVRESENAVRVYQLSKYKCPISGDLAEPYIYLPPQLAFARDNVKYPVRLPELTSSTGLISFSGPMLHLATPGAVSNETESIPSVYVAHYDLPIPPTDERGLLAIAGEEELKTLINAHVSDLGTTASTTGVDLFYKSRVQAFQAYSYLTTSTRETLLENSSVTVPTGFSSSIWNEDVEPFSGLKYWWTYYIEGPYFDKYDQDWGNGLSLIGLQTYITYTGNWNIAADNWEWIDRIFSWYTVTDDWEWLRCSNGIHGHGTGAGDCHSVVSAATLSYAKLAKGSGRPEDYWYGLYTAARAAVFTLNRFAYNDYGDQQKLKEPGTMVLGFHEGSGFLVGELDAYPWNVTSNISGNGVQPENFSLYSRYAPELLKSYEARFADAYPEWMDGKAKYPRPTVYRDNSGYITLPHIYLRARLAIDNFNTLKTHLEKARPNKYLWWLAPPVIAEMLNMRTADAYVANWGKCGFLGAQILRDKDKRIHVTARFDNRSSPDTVEFAIPRRPMQVEINDGPVPLTDSQFENGRLTVKLRRPGENKITIMY